MLETEAETERKRLATALILNGLNTGGFADVELRMFGRSLHLHRLILYSNPFFRAALDSSIAAFAAISTHKYSKGLRKNKDFKPHVLDIVAPPGVTFEGLNVIIERLYGVFSTKVTVESFFAILPAAYNFGDEPLCDECAIYISSLVYTPANILKYFAFATNYDFGPYSELLLRNCLTYLCQQGTNPALIGPILSKIEYNWLAAIVCSDLFFVSGEAERFEFLLKCVSQTRSGSDTNATNSSIVDRIKVFLSGSEIMNFSASEISPTTDSVVPADVKNITDAPSAIKEADTTTPDIISGKPAPADAKEYTGSDEEDTDDTDDTDENISENNSSLVNSIKKKRESGFSSNKRISFLDDIVEGDDEGQTGAPRQRANLQHTSSRQRFFVNAFTNSAPSSPTTATSPIFPYANLTPAQPIQLRPSTAHTKSFKERRDALLNSPRASQDPTAWAIETLSNGIIYAHLPATVLARMKATGVISPIVLGMQHKIALEFGARIRKSGQRTLALGIKYYNDRVGVSQIVAREFDNAAPNTSKNGSNGNGATTSGNDTAPSFYDWIFLDPFRHKLSEVPPFRFGVEFSIPKILGGWDKKVYAPDGVAYGGSLWYLMIKNEGAEKNGPGESGKPRVSIYLYRKHDKKISGYTDYRSPIQFWAKVCIYIHHPTKKPVTTEPYAFETISQITTGHDVKFTGDSNRMSGEELLTEVKDTLGTVVDTGVTFEILVTIASYSQNDDFTVNYKIRVAQNISLEEFKHKVCAKVNKSLDQLESLWWEDDGRSYLITDDMDLLEAFKVMLIIVCWKDKFAVSIPSSKSHETHIDEPSHAAY
ncbi:hypothetical protein HK100_006104, partial [Physocladia obscura]